MPLFFNWWNAITLIMFFKERYLLFNLMKEWWLYRLLANPLTWTVMIATLVHVKIFLIYTGSCLCIYIYVYVYVSLCVCVRARAHARAPVCACVQMDNGSEVPWIINHHCIFIFSWYDAFSFFLLFDNSGCFLCSFGISFFSQSLQILYGNHLRSG